MEYPINITLYTTKHDSFCWTSIKQNSNWCRTPQWILPGHPSKKPGLNQYGHFMENEKHITIIKIIYNNLRPKKNQQTLF